MNRISHPSRSSGSRQAVRVLRPRHANHARWRWHSEWDIPNAGLWTRPFGFYLRTRRFRLTAGEMFGWHAGRS